MLVKTDSYTDLNNQKKTSAMILSRLASGPYLLCIRNYSEIPGFILIFTPNFTLQ